MKRITALLLAMFMLAATAISCANGADSQTSDGNDGSAETEAKELSAEEKRQQIQDSLPSDLNFSGESVRILALDGVNEFVLDAEDTGNRLNDALYRRDVAVAERLGVTLDYTPQTWDKLQSTFETSVNADSDDYDIYLGQAIKTGVDVMNGYCHEIAHLENTDYSMPWYNTNTIEALTLNDKMYMCVGSVNISAMGFTNCMYFSKEAVSNYNIPDVYATVNDGKWTYDTLYGITSIISEDVNGNGKADAGDYFGLSSRFGDIPVFMWAFDQDIVQFTDDGDFEITYFCEKTVDIVEKVKNLLMYNPGAVYSKSGEDFYGIKMFSLYYSAFAFGMFKDSIGTLSEYDNYGIIPFPKYDEAQENYYTIADGSCTVTAVPAYAKDENLPKIGAAIELLCEETYKLCELEYYDIALKVKGARDEESVNMLDLIFNSRIMDLAYIHDAWQGLAFSLEGICRYEQELASFYESKSVQVTEYYQKLSDFYFN